MQDQQRCSYGADGAFKCAPGAPPLFPSDGPFRPPYTPQRFSCGATPSDGALTRARSAGPVPEGGEPFKRPPETAVPGPFVESSPMPVGMFTERISAGRSA